MGENPTKLSLPVVALRDTALFPGMRQTLEIVRKSAINAVRTAVDAGGKIFITMQKNPEDEEPNAEGLNSVGVLADIIKVSPGKKADYSQIVVVDCGERARAESFTHKQNKFYGEIRVCPQEETEDNLQKRFYINNIYKELRVFNSLTDKLKAVNIERSMFTEGEYIKAIYYVAAQLPLNGEIRQAILDQEDFDKLNSLLISFIHDQNIVLKLRKEIEHEVKQNIDKSQAEYYLREQLKVISNKLEGDNSPAAEAESYREKIRALDMPEISREQMLKTCDKLAKLAGGSAEAAVERTYLDTCLALPWGVFSEEKADIAAAQTILDRDHFGMEKVKERMVEFIAVRALAPNINGQIICLVGPPGVGKTSIAHSVAEALGRKYQRISLGGVHDESDIRGHRKTYIGSMPGRIYNALKLAGTMNPLILLDEVDKLTASNQGDPSAALLEVLDPEQNVSFTDHYLGVPMDLSRAVFITTANDASRIPAPLLDRMEVIELPSYTLEEKCNIAKQHLIKKQLMRHGLNGNQLRITAKAVSALIEGYTREAGVRNLEREIASLCRKAAKKIALGDDSRITITDKNLEEYLGSAKYSREKTSANPEVGVVNGLAWTSVGGTMLEVEAAVMEGSGRLELTGSLGDVMKESAQAAVSFIRTRANEWGIAPDFYKTKDIHIHVPEGATPKDGPSAGVTITTALVSALTGIPVRSGVAMTGEVTLRGRVLAIGGQREKSMAAFSAGIDTVIIPAENTSDVPQLSDSVRSALNFVPVTRAEEVLATALEHMPQSAQL